MLRFFRKMRQALVPENRFGRYFFYAIGEIVLVVIGILIALQVNNWNEERKLHASEQIILESLSKEFEYNLLLIKETIDLNIVNINSAKQIGKYTGPASQITDEKNISTLMKGAFKNQSIYLPSLGGLLEIINSGKLSVLSDQQLRIKLASFESVLDKIKAQEKTVFALQDNAHQFFLKEGNFRRHLYLIEDDLIESDPSKFPNNDFKFLKNPEFESYLYLYIVAATNLNKNYYSDLQNRMNEIIELINQSKK